MSDRSEGLPPEAQFKRKPMTDEERRRSIQESKRAWFLRNKDKSAEATRRYRARKKEEARVAAASQQVPPPVLIIVDSKGVEIPVPEPTQITYAESKELIDPNRPPCIPKQ